MKAFSALRAAADAVATNASRPATAVVHDAPDARLVVFRLTPGQVVTPHRDTSTVVLTVLAGRGLVSAEEVERSVGTGDVIAYGPNELHGMRAVDEELMLLAAITPRPGSRSEVHAVARASAPGGSGGAA